MNNAALRKSMFLLMHPLTLGALGVLLLNDHLLRRVWPSWWTGKLGDAAWLFFAPLALAVLVALCMPRRWQNATRGVALIAFTLVGAVFTLAKTAPFAHQAVIGLAEAVLGFSVGLRRDPTDLLTLPALMASATLWTRTEAPAAALALRRGRPHEAGWVALGLAALLTVANSPAPDPGIYCVAALDGKVYAFAAYNGYESTDGGLTWADTAQAPVDCGRPWDPESPSEVVREPSRPDLSYRFTAGAAIEVSRDGGATWQNGYDPAELSEAERAVIERRATNASMRPTPMDGVIDPATGNAVFAMGHNGVVVYADQAWRAVAVGRYRAPEALTLSDVAALLVGEALLALAAALLAFVTLIAAADPRRRIWQIFLIAAAWLGWLGIVFLLGPAPLTGYGVALSYVALLGVGVLLVGLLVMGIVRISRGVSVSVGRTVGVAAAAGILFFLPYLFWAFNAVPIYLLAAGFGVVLAAVTVAAGRGWVRAGRDNSAGRGEPR